MLFPFGRRSIICSIPASYVEEVGSNRALEDTRGLGEEILYQSCRKYSLDPSNIPFHVTLMLVNYASAH